VIRGKSTTPFNATAAICTFETCRPTLKRSGYNDAPLGRVTAGNSGFGRIDLPRNYLQGVPWPDPHHRHRDAPPDQQEEGSSLKP
jgi:hypothetical protein